MDRYICLSPFSITILNYRRTFKLSIARMVTSSRRSSLQYKKTIVDLRHHSEDNDFNNKTGLKLAKMALRSVGPTLRWFIWVGINPHTATLTYPGERLYILQLTHVYLLLTSQKVGLHTMIRAARGGGG